MNRIIAITALAAALGACDDVTAAVGVAAGRLVAGAGAGGPLLQPAAASSTIDTSRVWCRQRRVMRSPSGDLAAFR